MKVLDVVISDRPDTRTHYVYEFIGADGSLPPNLRGMALDEPACFVTTPRPKTMTGMTAAPVRLFEEFDYFDPYTEKTLRFAVTEITSSQFLAPLVEIKAVEVRGRA
jgi:hypothetical protein